MAQSLQLMEIVNKNQKEVNRLKEELEQLKVHTDNATATKCKLTFDIGENIGYSPLNNIQEK